MPRTQDNPKLQPDCPLGALPPPPSASPFTMCPTHVERTPDMELSFAVACDQTCV